MGCCCKYWSEDWLFSLFFFLVFRAIRTGNLPRHDDSQPGDGENRDQP
ncbi:hypothetical protein CHCC19466_3361 [Bacillus licheniformis]|nr:hypothetical protein CHCC20493_2789 [Bacillus licheniformis]TWJ91604.1 hypothetical protein CHCC20495_2449 [Bacillus licheniformis]TWK18389.1 hypothetical protein CHCC20373_2411 [Bacillus licheniformis]TWL12407.1 hypothetical protein CHCC19466_3361 [Bacillus licheniformis]TWL84402.1 hypothetical protein CHCC15291_2412 [Bacillus licheniformis]